MRILKSKLSIFLLLALFVGLTSFSMSAENQPCWYGNMYFERSFAYPAWPFYGIEWTCLYEPLITCAYLFNSATQQFDACMTGQVWSYIL